MRQVVNREEAVDIANGEVEERNDKGGRKSGERRSGRRRSGRRPTGQQGMHPFCTMDYYVSTIS